MELQNSNAAKPIDKFIALFFTKVVKNGEMGQSEEFTLILLIVQRLILFVIKSDSKRTQLEKYIEVNPKVIMGKPVIKGTRITVELILEKLAAEDTIEDILAEHPRLKREHVLAALSFAANMLNGEKLIALAA